MDGIRPLSKHWLGSQGRSTILPLSPVIKSGPYHGSAVLTSKLKVIFLRFLICYSGCTSRTVVTIFCLYHICVDEDTKAINTKFLKDCLCILNF